jgi:hypothetical protein
VLLEDLLIAPPGFAKALSWVMGLSLPA